MSNAANCGAVDANIVCHAAMCWSGLILHRAATPMNGQSCIIVPSCAIIREERAPPAVVIKITATSSTTSTCRLCINLDSIDINVIQNSQKYQLPWRPSENARGAHAKCTCLLVRSLAVLVRSFSGGEAKEEPTLPSACMHFRRSRIKARRAPTPLNQHLYTFPLFVLVPTLRVERRLPL